MTDGTTIEFERSHRSRARYRTRRLAFAALALGGIVLVVIAWSLISSRRLASLEHDEEALVPPNPEEPQPPSWSKLRVFKRGAVCADGPPCAQIGKSMLDRNGSAVDVTVATMICNGLVTMQSMGIGGGFLMTIYKRSTGEAFVLNAREAAPLKSSYDMYSGKPEASHKGAMAMGVPGEVAGYWEAHRRFGKLPWRELFEPSIELCRRGVNITKHMHDALQIYPPNVHQDPTLRALFVDPETETFKPIGTLIRPKKICETLRKIADEGAAVFYNGSVAEMLVQDVQKLGGILSLEDLKSYRAKWSKPLVSELGEGTKLFAPGLPGGGPLLVFVLNVLKNYALSPASLADVNSTVITYHRMIEAFKYAHAMRSHFGDSDFVDMRELLKNLTSEDFARSTWEKISDERTWNEAEHYGAEAPGPEDHGTAHISVLAPNGDAVSVTSSINFYFGGGVVSPSTGIVMNNVMDDFSVPSVTNYFEIPPSKENYIAPGKQPLSSMTPSIVVGEDDEVRMVVGAAGGTKITTSITNVIARYLWMGNTIKEAVDSARIHHQTFPMKVSYEYGVPSPVIEGLAKLGHKTSRYRARLSVVCAIVRAANGTILANADYRKGGDVYGID